MQSWVHLVVWLSAWWWTFVVSSTVAPGVLLCDFLHLVDVQVLGELLEDEV